MAWTTPRTWVPGELVTASMMNTHIRDNMNYLFTAASGDKCRATNGAQSISDNTATKLTFGSETFDTNGLHSTSSNPSRITIVTTGYYIVIGWVYWNSAGGSSRWLRILVNNTTLYNTNRVSSASFDNAQSVDDLISFTAGDYVELSVVQESGGSLNTVGQTFSVVGQ